MKVGSGQPHQVQFGDILPILKLGLIWVELQNIDPALLPHPLIMHLRLAWICLQSEKHDLDLGLSNKKTEFSIQHFTVIGVLTTPWDFFSPP